jgi:predicted enzyme related to lactoylglutathione lyase
MVETLTVRGIDATYYMTKDVAKAAEFYNRLLGTEPAMHMPGMFVEYTFADGAAFGLYQSDNFYTGGTVMFGVDDVPTFVKSAMANGVSFMGDGRIEDTPNCHMAFGTDPDGNAFIIHKVK